MTAKLDEVEELEMRQEIHYIMKTLGGKHKGDFEETMIFEKELF